MKKYEWETEFSRHCMYSSTYIIWKTWKSIGRNKKKGKQRPWGINKCKNFSAVIKLKTEKRKINLPEFKTCKNFKGMNTEIYFLLNERNYKKIMGFAYIYEAV